MESVLETVITFVGIMLVLALAAQSAQEIVKTTFAPKGRVTLYALRGLVRQAAIAERQTETDGDDIFNEIVSRLQALGQQGFGKKGIRLDALTGPQLSDLIARVDPAKVSGLKALGDGTAVKRLEEIGIQACKWYALAMNPISGRYGRRMRALALGTSAVVVLAVNADAFHIVDVVRTDPEMRARMVDRDSTVAAADLTVVRFADSLGVLAASSDTAAARPLIAAVAVQLDSAATVRNSLVQQARADLSVVLGGPSDWERSELRWWIGIILSTLLVSMGAPFWHDVLGAVFGLKLRRQTNPAAPPTNGDRAEKQAD